MKLCRFELVSDPGVGRSGIFYDGRFYETDGEKAIGIRDPGQIRLLAPTGTPPALRIFDRFVGSDGTPRITFHYGHSQLILGPTSEIDCRSHTGLDFDVRIGALIQEGEIEQGPAEAERMLLGVGILLTFFESQERDELLAEGQSVTFAYDFGSVFGPFLATPDELTDNKTTDEPTEFTWEVKISISGEQVHHVIARPEFSLYDLIDHASKKSQPKGGEVFAWPAFEKPSLDNTKLKRFLLPGDSIQVEIEPIGTLVCRII